MATTINAHLYKVTDTINNLFYVGKHNGIEQKGYWGSGRKWLKYIKEVGTNNLKYEILAIGNIDYIFDIERQYVTLDFIKNNSNCMNIRSGGHGNSQLSEETKQKLREAITLEIRQKLRMVHLGKKKSPEHIAKTSASRKGKTPWNKGIPATEKEN